MRSLITAITAAAVLAPAASFATNGMFMIGYGAKSISMGGAAIANPQDTFASAVNPAAAGLSGDRFDIGTELFRPSAYAKVGSYQQDSVASHNDSLNLFIIPHIGYTKVLNPDTTFAFTFVGAGGGATRYEKNPFIINQADPTWNKPAGISMDIAQMNPTLALKINKSNYVGATMILSFQKFRAIGLDYFNAFTSTFVDSGGATQTTTLTDNGNNYAYGAGLRLGWLGKFMDDKLMLGAMGSSKVYMTKFDDYADLFPEQGDLDTPAVFGVGAGYKLTPKLTAALDITYTMYEDVKAIGNQSANPDGSSGSVYPINSTVNALGKDAGMGFGWENQTVFKIGLAYDLSRTVALRTGWNYGKSPIPSDNGALLFNVLAPATTQNHFTMGATYRTDPSTEWNLVYMYAFKYAQYGPMFVGGSGEIGMSQNSLGVTYDWKF
jgi:long-chain fatty acid transport protein